MLAPLAAGVVSWQSAPMLVSADCARCGGAVSWLRRLRAFLFQPVACQQVVGYCLAICVYAGVIFPQMAARGGDRVPVLVLGCWLRAVVLVLGAGAGRRELGAGARF